MFLAHGSRESTSTGKEAALIRTSWLDPGVDDRSMLEPDGTADLGGHGGCLRPCWLMIILILTRWADNVGFSFPFHPIHESKISCSTSTHEDLIVGNQENHEVYGVSFS